MRVLALLFLFVVVAGCDSPMASSPLVAPNNAESFPEFHGTYKSVLDDNWLHVGDAGDQFPVGFIKVVAVGQIGDEKSIGSESFVCFAVKMHDIFLVHVPLTDDCSIENQLDKFQNKWNANEDVEYLILRVKKTGKGLSVSMLDADFVADQIRQSKLDGTSKWRHSRSGIGVRETKITATTEKLEAWFKNADPSLLFEKSSIDYREINEGK